LATATRAGSPVIDPAAKPRRFRLALICLTAAGVAGTGVAFWVALAGGYGGHGGLVATSRAAAVAIPMAVGLHQWRHGPSSRFALLLVGLGMVMVPVALAESHASLPYSIGRAGGFAAELLLIVLFLLYPGGTLRRRSDRWVAGAAVAVILGLYLPTVLLAGAFPSPAVVSTCVRDCPANALAITNTEPAVVDDVLRPLRETATVLLMLIVAGLVAARLRVASRLARRTLAPVLVVAVVHALTLAAFFALRAAGADPAVTGPVGWIVYLGIPGLALGLAAAEVRRRQYVATALERLAAGLATHVTAASLRQGMARSLEDPGLRITFWLEDGHGRWVDESGWPIAAPPDDDATVTEIHSRGRLVGALRHDAWLTEAPALLVAASSYALVVLENERLVTDLRTSLDELAQSRARVVAVADRERHRIERDLHDGAQQRLVGLRIQLELAAQRLRRVQPRESDALMVLGGDVEETIDEVRAIAGGLYPAVLAEQGLEEALRGSARRAAVATGVSARGVRRWAPEIETTVYFACAEAIQNAVKHARGAQQIAILLDGNEGRLRFEVRDDGSGFVNHSNGNGNGSHSGTGLLNMRDRVAAIGGELTIVSSPGRGTRVIGSVPTG
jgi:signal transduction histidine kinase